MSSIRELLSPCAIDGRGFDRTGQRSGRLMVLRSMKASGHGTLYWECKCDCGTISYVVSGRLNGQTQSCGCLTREAVSRAKRTLGLSKSPTYRVWRGMKQRCKNPRDQSYSDYGGRGISYDPRWERFEHFFADMGECPAGLWLDRRDNDGNYSKDNCRWATPMQQENNRRSNRIVEFRGERFTVAELARKTGQTHNRLRYRLNRGWSVEKAATASNCRGW